MSNTKNVLSFMGICMKAGKLVSGEFAVDQAVKGGHAWLVVVAGDISANGRKHYSNMCSFYQVPLLFFSDKNELGRALGKEYRASLAVTDERLAAALKDKIIAASIE